MADFIEQLNIARQARVDAGKDPYTNVRDSVEDTDVRAGWRGGDRWKDYVREQYEAIDADETLSEEGRVVKKQEVYDGTAARAAKDWESARKRARQLAREYEKRSVPMPGGTLYGNPITSDTEMLAIQNEADRLSKRLSGSSLQERTRAVSQNPNDSGMQGAGNHTLDVLRREYNTAMEEGGKVGRIRAHAVLRVAEETGVSYDAVTSDHRSETHKSAFEKAREYEGYAFAIPSERAIPQPSAESRRNRKGNYGKGRSAMLGSKQGPVATQRKRKPSWK